MTKEINPNRKTATFIDPDAFKLNINLLPSFVDDTDDTTYNVVCYDEYLNEYFSENITSEDFDDAMKKGLNLFYNFCEAKIKALESIQNTLLKQMEQL